MINSEFVKQYDWYIDYCIKRYHPRNKTDCKQDIYLILCRSTFKETNIKAYLSKVIRNYFNDKYRYENRQKRKEEKITPSPVTNQGENHLIYERALTKLKGLKDNEALKMFAEGYKYREIADILKVSVNCIKARIHRLRIKINGNRQNRTNK